MSDSYSYSPEMWPALIMLALAIYLGTYTWRRRNIPAAKPFAVACTMGGIWAVGVAFELSAEDFAAEVFWVKFQAIWQIPIATAITCFLFQYAGLGRWTTRRNIILLSMFPLLSVLAMVTNDLHHLVWTGFRMGRYAVATPGRLYWFFNSYIYLLGLVNFVVLARLAVHSPGHRLPVAIILTGQIIGRVGYTLDKLETGLFGPGESLLFTAGVVGSAYAFALTRLNIIDPAAGAHLLRVVQEALTNAQKHSGARILKVDMALSGRRALITIRDDGRGFDAGHPEEGGSGHFGLIFMRERMEQIGGSLTIESIPGSGTILKLDVPIREQPADPI